MQQFLRYKFERQIFSVVVLGLLVYQYPRVPDIVKVLEVAVDSIHDQGIQLLLLVPSLAREVGLGQSLPVIQRHIHRAADPDPHESVLFFEARSGS
jgi:hypothetical protein